MKYSAVCRQRNALDLTERQSGFKNWKAKSEIDTSRADSFSPSQPRKSIDVQLYRFANAAGKAKKVIKEKGSELVLGWDIRSPKIIDAKSPFHQRLSVCSSIPSLRLRPESSRRERL
jgi:hypothetical protein